MDAGEDFSPPYACRDRRGEARNQAARTLPVIVGFAVGRGIEAACETVFGLWSLALPAGLALLAFVMGFAAERNSGRGP